MRRILLFILACALSFAARAQDPFFAQTASLAMYKTKAETAATLGGTVASGPSSEIGTLPWANPAAALAASDSASASVTATGASQVSNYLKITNLGFAIPASATVTGVVVTVNLAETVNSPHSSVSDIRLLVAGTTCAAAACNLNAGSITTVSTTLTYGANNVLWNYTALTPAQINASDFGVAFSATTGSDSTVISVDWIKIKVYFTDTTGLTSPIYGSGTNLFNLAHAEWVEAQATVAAPVGTVTNPSLAVKLQSSMDGTNWDDVIAFTAVTTGTGHERKSANRFSSTPALMGRFWRWTGTVTADSGDATYYVTGLLLLGRR